MHASRAKLREELPPEQSPLAYTDAAMLVPVNATFNEAELESGLHMLPVAIGPPSCKCQQQQQHQHNSGVRENKGNNVVVKGNVQWTGCMRSR